MNEASPSAIPTPRPQHEHAPASQIIYPEGVHTPGGPRPLPVSQTAISGLQHVIAMFGSTVLGPLLMGFDPNVAIFCSGIGTIIFWFLVPSIPSYLGSSFSFIATVVAITGYAGKTGPNPNISVALGGIIAAGVLYALIGFAVFAVGHQRIRRLMPAEVTGVIVVIIGLNLAKVAVDNVGTTAFGTIIGLTTVLLVALPALYAPRFYRRLPILIGAVLSYFIYLVFANSFGYGPPIDFAGVAAAHWVGLPQFTAPRFEASAVWAIAPIAVVLVAENLGHVSAIGSIMHRHLDGSLWRAFVADGIATTVSGAFGGTGVTTYAENIGVMAVTRNLYRGTFLAAGIFALLLGLSPKVGALIQTLPMPVLGGLAFVLFGLITASGFRIWVENSVDFKSPKNLMTAGVAVIMGAGDFTVHFRSFSLGGIATATFAALCLYHLLREPSAG